MKKKVLEVLTNEEAFKVLAAWRDEEYRKAYVDALTKVAMDWQEKVKDWGHNSDVVIIEVQAFLDSRHVHYPECWPPTHPHYKQKTSNPHFVQDSSPEEGKP